MLRPIIECMFELRVLRETACETSYGSDRKA